MSGVLPGEVDDGTCEPDVEVYLRCVVVLCCGFLSSTDKVRKVGDGIEGKEAL